MNNKTEGVLEPNGREGGHLRDPKVHYVPRPADVEVSAALCRKWSLRGGEAIVGAVAEGHGGRRGRKTLTAVDAINGVAAEAYGDIRPFDDLVAIDPDRPLKFELPDGSMSMRVVDLMTPIGLGQRGLIVAPPRTGKTILLQQMAQGIAANHPDAQLFMLLVDERPEEVTDMRRKVRGEVAASSNDHDALSHLRLARLIIARAKRLVEMGRDVVILLDSLTRLGRASNSAKRGTGRTMSGGLDSSALTEPKSIFGAARNVENGGSLTIIATALIDTGSRMDEVIFNEFKGTGNMEIVLSREIANRRVWPAIDLNQSGTRKEERLLTPEALQVSYLVRRALHDRDPVRSMEQLLEAMGRHPTNAAFVRDYASRPLR